jgi:NAD-dependent dihydropyrimidine dehydrogenase PreA subunit
VWAGVITSQIPLRDVKAAYSERNEELVPKGISGIIVAIDWYCCIADSFCIDVCPVKLYQ